MNLVNSVQTNLAAATAERNRIEYSVWKRNMSDAAFPDDRTPYLRALGELMELSERKRWRAICITIEEIEKHVAQT